MSDESEADVRRQAQKNQLYAFLNDNFDPARFLEEMSFAGQEKPFSKIKPVRVPRDVYLYWHDGWENAPDVAQLCLRSWTAHNQDWKVHALDYATLPLMLERPPVHTASLKLAGFSDRVRLALLREKGGVWADATLFCSQPIGTWTDLLAAASGFFAFSAPAPDRIISTWFLIACQGSDLVQAWDEIISRYFQCLEYRKNNVQAYFFAHYLLEYVIEKHPRLFQLWNLVPKIPVGASRAGMITQITNLPDADEKLADEELNEKQITRVQILLKEGIVHKLTWKAAMRQRSRRSLQLLELLEDDLRLKAKA